MDFNPRLMNHRSRSLAETAMRLAKEHQLQPSERLGLYCVLEIPHRDEEVAKIMLKAADLTQTFEREVRPTRALEQMPVVQAFWSALALGARGPVRIFNQSSAANEDAVEQAHLDLKDGLCDIAMILNSHPHVLRLNQ